jgi:phosphoglycerate dehydrogenase-like enzyme
MSYFEFRGSLFVIELTWTLILASARHIVAENASLREGGWQRHVGDDMAGRTLGLLGLGNIGGAVAKIGKAFDMNVIAWSPNLTAERAAEFGAVQVSKEELFRRADVVSIHLVLSKRTRGLVGAVELSLMKPTARLVNTPTTHSESCRTCWRLPTSASSRAGCTSASTRTP